MLRLDQPAMKTESSIGSADGEEEEQAGVEVDEHHVAADGQHGETQEDSDHEDAAARGSGRRASALSGNDVFLGEGLDAVGDGLEEAEGAGAVGAEAVLNAAEALALEDSGEGEESREGREDRDDAERTLDQRAAATAGK